MKQELHVHISGPAEVGKSMLAGMLSQWLEQHGHIVAVRDECKPSEGRPRGVRLSAGSLKGHASGYLACTKRNPVVITVGEAAGQH